MSEFDLTLGAPDGDSFGNVLNPAYSDGDYTFETANGADTAYFYIHSSDLSSFAGGDFTGVAYPYSDREDQLGGALTLTSTTGVPEPAALSLLCVAGLGLVRRRRP